MRAPSNSRDEVSGATPDATTTTNLQALTAAKPEKAPKGRFILSASISSSMGTGHAIDVATLDPSSPRFFREV